MMPSDPSPNSRQSPSTFSSESSSGSSQYGALLAVYGDRPGQRYGWVAFGVGFVLVGIILGASSGFGPLPILLMVGGPIACAVQVYYGYGARARLFEQGFIISRSGKTTSGYWKNVAKVTHEIQQSRLFGIIPIGVSNHNYTIFLTMGERIRIYGTYFSNSQQLGNTITQMVKNAHTTPDFSPEA